MPMAWLRASRLRGPVPSRSTSHPSTAANAAMPPAPPNGRRAAGPVPRNGATARAAPLPPRLPPAGAGVNGSAAGPSPRSGGTPAPAASRPHPTDLAAFRHSSCQPMGHGRRVRVAGPQQPTGETNKKLRGRRNIIFESGGHHWSAPARRRGHAAADGGSAGAAAPRAPASPSPRSDPADAGSSGRCLGRRCSHDYLARCDIFFLIFNGHASLRRHANSRARPPALRRVAHSRARPGRPRSAIQGGGRGRERGGRHAGTRGRTIAIPASAPGAPPSTPGRRAVGSGSTLGARAAPRGSSPRGCQQEHAGRARLPARAGRACLPARARLPARSALEKARSGARSAKTGARSALEMTLPPPRRRSDHAVRSGGEYVGAPRCPCGQVGGMRTPPRPFFPSRPSATRASARTAAVPSPRVPPHGLTGGVVVPARHCYYSFS